MIMSSELLHAERKCKKDPREASEKILETVKIDPALYRFGETKVVQLYSVLAFVLFIMFFLCSLLLFLFSSFLCFLFILSFIW